MTPTRRRLNVQNLLLGCALVWAVLLVVVSATVPILSNATSQGSYHPQQTVLAVYGAAGMLPAVGLLLLGAVTAGLLLSRQRTPVRAARVLASVVFVASYASLLVLGSRSLLVVPFGALLAAAAFVPQPRERRP